MPESPLDVVNQQAEDHGLWFDAPAAYVRLELRRLHAAVEAVPVVDVADLTHRIAHVLADGTGREEDEQEAAEAVVEMMLTAGDLPRATPDDA